MPDGLDLVDLLPYKDACSLSTGSESYVSSDREHSSKLLFMQVLRLQYMQRMQGG